jgi:hypothetical protein
MDILKVIETLEERYEELSIQSEGMVPARKGSKWAKMKRKARKYGRFYNILSMPEAK